VVQGDPRLAEQQVMRARRYLSRGISGLFLGWIGLCLGLAIGWLLWSGDAPELPELPSVAGTSPASRSDTVLVIVVETEQNVETVRGAVAPDRVVVASQQGIAVSPRRLVVTSVEHAGELLTAAGWSDHSLEIVDMRRSRGESRPEQGGKVDSTLARITSLINDPARTLADAKILLDSM
jgi:hypothetical protein